VLVRPSVALPVQIKLLVSSKNPSSVLDSPKGNRTTTARVAANAAAAITAEMAMAATHFNTFGSQVHYFLLPLFHSWDLIIAYVKAPSRELTDNLFTPRGF
jgi:hypothetical protein